MKLDVNTVNTYYIISILMDYFHISKQEAIKQYDSLSESQLQEILDEENFNKIMFYSD